MESNPADWLPQMEGLLQTLNEGVLIVDAHDGVVFANQCMEELVGLPAVELVGQTPSHFYSGEDLEFLNEQIAHSVEHGRNRYEFYVPKADGSKVPVIISSRSIKTPDGRRLGVVTFTDISAQKQAEEKLRQANQELAQRQREIEADLALASQVQRSLVPQATRWGQLSIDTAYLPVRTIGGDFGLVVPREEEHLNLLVCDVSGHGIGSALIANRIYSEAISLLEQETDLGGLLRRLNNFVIQQIMASGFLFSMIAARLDHQGRWLTYANAGHPPAFWISSIGECRRLEARSVVLGCFEEAISDEPTQQVEIAPGDRLIFYTDGLTEVFNHRREMLGVQGLERIIQRAAKQSLVEMKQTVLNEVAAWRDGPGTDDISLVAIEAL
jgi:sigma-B regulation protein RsbU (phosphoserine phosphatase)